MSNLDNQINSAAKPMGPPGASQNVPLFPSQSPAGSAFYQGTNQPSNIARDQPSNF